MFEPERTAGVDDLGVVHKNMDPSLDGRDGKFFCAAIRRHFEPIGSSGLQIKTREGRLSFPAGAPAVSNGTRGKTCLTCS
ncbi:hypothetical protein GCM10010862_02580 [Devosia nitrariae]|uniref:Uncharacterized protein n=1 Tax=Devosia nitrariae TaxID=2071872 RepID=A0ABQ5VYW3_9HYPH|nr:hypothetical protein GCM10010862_02580 [Devosia nitrariae]